MLIEQATWGYDYYVGSETDDPEDEDLSDQEHHRIKPGSWGWSGKALGEMKPDRTGKYVTKLERQANKLLKGR